MRRRDRVLTWAPFLLTVGLVVTSLVLPQGRVNTSETFAPWVLTVMLTVQALTFATVALVIQRAHPGHAIGLLFAGVGVFVGFYLAAERYQYLALVVRDGELPLGVLAAWLQAWTYVPALAIMVAFLPQLFPTGRPLTPRWRWGLWLAAVASLGIAAGDALTPGVISQSVVENPVGLSESAHERLTITAGVIYLSTALVSFASLVVRWRRATRGERQQLKLFALVASLLPLFVTLSALGGGGDEGGAVMRLVFFLVAMGAFLGLPVATALSIVRHRLYDIDVVINRALVYAVLSALLVGTYLVGVLVLRVALDPLTGDSDLAVAASTLAVAALFRPLRARVQGAVDRHFYRSRYDATRTMSDFTDRLRHEVDLDSLGTELRAVVRDTMQPTHVSLWLRRDP